MLTNFEETKEYAATILKPMKGVMSNLSKTIFLVVCCCAACIGIAKGLNNARLEGMLNALDNAPYASKISELNKRNAPYILTESLWANASKDIRAVVISAQKENFGSSNIACVCVEDNANAKNFINSIAHLMTVSKDLPTGLISGIDLVKDARRSLPYVLTRVTIFDGEKKAVILFNEIAHVRNERDKSNCVNSKNIINVNNFIDNYMRFLEEFNAACALDYFVPKFHE